jgi:D-serine deaminase-like pyridoxal phosphate-dependent protein
MNIQKPTIILNPAVVRSNIARMAAKARQNSVMFRPHFKTHQSAQIGDWFKDEGITAITVSSVSMAQYFAAQGWRDITIAFPVNWLEIDAINALAAQINLHLVLESAETAQFLQEKLHHPVNIWLEIDSGYGRTGIVWDNTSLLLAVAKSVQAANHLTLQGLLTHSGQTYRIQNNPSEIQAIYDSVLEKMQYVKKLLAENGVAHLKISIGDTPTCAILENFAGIDEMRPGNFVFFDMTQVRIGACQVEDVGVAVACPVVAKHPDRNVLVIYGGAVHLSRDYDALPDGTLYYGRVALPTANGWSAALPETYVKSISQEHGVIQTTSDIVAKINVGDVVYILPIHSCLTVDMLKRYQTPDGAVLTMMPGIYEAQA